MNLKLISIGIISIFLLALLSASVSGLNIELNEKKSTVLSDELSVKITKPEIGYIYKNGERWLYILEARATIIGHCDIELEYSENVVMEKTKYYVDDDEVDLEDFLIKDGQHIYKVEVFDEQDNTDIDQVLIKGIGTKTKSFYTNHFFHFFFKFLDFLN